MKYLILILLLTKVSFPFEDSLVINFVYQEVEYESLNRMNSANIPFPSSTSFLVDHENINNPDIGDVIESLAFVVKPINEDSIRKMELNEWKYSFVTNRLYEVYSQFDRLDSSWIEKDSVIKITIWPKVSVSQDWNTSMVLTGDTSQSWDDVITRGSRFKMTHIIYNGTKPNITEVCRLTGYAEIYNSKLYDRQEYAYIIELANRRDSINAYEDSVETYREARRDSIRLVIDSIRIADSLATPIILPSIKEELVRFGMFYDLLGRRKRVATMENLTYAKKRRFQ